MDTDVSVSVTWTGPKSFPGERYSVMEASGSGGTYTGSLTIRSLAEGQDDGKYTCNVTVNGSSSVLVGAGSDSTTIDVNGNLLLHTNKPQHLYMPCLDNTHVQIHVYVYAFV